MHKFLSICIDIDELDTYLDVCARCGIQRDVDVVACFESRFFVLVAHNDRVRSMLFDVTFLVIRTRLCQRNPHCYVWC